MLELLTTHQFERDFVRQLKSGKDKKKFLKIINKLLNRQQFDQKHNRRKNRESRGAVQMSRSGLFIVRRMNSAYPNKVTKSNTVPGPQHS